MKKSVELLAQDIAIMIFPENSEEGYKDELTDFFPGFVLVAKGYKKAYGEDIQCAPSITTKRRG